MKDNAKCFIKIKKGTYEEITYKELERRREECNIYKNKKFIPLHKSLLEVSENEYKEFYKEVEQKKYRKRQSQNFKFISINNIENDNVRGKDILVDENCNIEFEVEKKMEIERLRNALLQLTEEEYKLIKALFYDEKTVREYAEIKGIPFASIQYRKKLIIEKLKKILKI